MSHGIKIVQQNGAAVNIVTGFTFVDAITVPANTGGGSRAYPNLNDFTFHLLPIMESLSIANLSLPYVTYDAGYPIVYWANTGTTYTIYVMGS